LALPERLLVRPELVLRQQARLRELALAQQAL
jgi:hypothetical protein